MDAKKQGIALSVVAAAMLALPLLNAHTAAAPLGAPPLGATGSEATLARSSMLQIDITKTTTSKPKATSKASVADREPTQPLDNMRITSNFGPRFHPILHRVLNHDGLDLGAHLNDPVYSVYDGVITSAGWRGGYGNAVQVYHSKLKKTTLYGHLNKIEVRKGQKVAEGQVIGLAGTTGLSTGVHLHFGVEDRSGWENPVAFLDGLTEAPASTMVATKSVTPYSARPVRVTTTTTTRVASVRRSTKTVQIASTKPQSKSIARTYVAKAKSKPTSAPPVVAHAKPKPQVDIASLQSRYDAAAAKAAEFTALYDAGAVSRNDRDERIASAKALESALTAAKAN